LKFLKPVPPRDVVTFGRGHGRYRTSKADQSTIGRESKNGSWFVDCSGGSGGGSNKSRGQHSVASYATQCVRRLVLYYKQNTNNRKQLLHVTEDVRTCDETVRERRVNRVIFGQSRARPNQHVQAPRRAEGLSQVPGHSGGQCCLQDAQSLHHGAADGLQSYHHGVAVRG
jgi:hypothetical protein